MRQFSKQETGVAVIIHLHYRSFAWNMRDSVLSFLFTYRDSTQYVTINNTKRAIDGLIRLSIFVRCNGPRNKFAVHACDGAFYAGIRNS